MLEGRGWTFPLFGVPVTVSPWFLLVALFGIDYLDLGLDFYLVYVAAVFVSVLVHEMGHAFAFRRLRQEPRVLVSSLMGLTYGSAPFKSRRDDVVVSLAGSTFQLLVLALPLWLLGRAVIPPGGWIFAESRSQAVLYFAIHILKWMSFLWAVVNLLPILPLDGGHIAQAFFGRSTTRKISVVTSVAAFLVCGAFFSFGLGVIFVILGGLNGYEWYLETKQQAGQQYLPPSPGEYGGGFGGGDYGPARRPQRGAGTAGRAAARRKATHLRPVPDTPEELVGPIAGPETKVDKVEAVAWSALREGRVDEAKRALARVPDGATVDPFLRPAVDLVAGDTDHAIAGFEQAYVARPEGPSGLLPATLLGQHGEARKLAVRILGHQGGGPAFAVSGLQGHLHYAKHWVQSATVGELLWGDDRANKAQVAFEVGCSWSRGGDVEAALEWIGRAIDAGFDSGSTLDREADLADTRADPRWVSLRARLA